MLELIFVIIILGIVSSIGAEIIANTYESYIVQRAQHRASLKTELAATQIANRLARAIPGTVMRRNGLTSADVSDINIPRADNPTILQWVGADIDSFNATPSPAVSPFLPGWSGFVDVDNSPLGAAVISTPGSDLTLTSAIITNLGGTIGSSAIFYKAANVLQRRGISSVTANTITLDSNVTNISEHYKLAWTSYALHADANNNLWLYYDFMPTVGTNIANHKSELLLRNVTTFKFRGDGQTVRFKICSREEIGEDYNITICKEKAVF